MVLGRPWEGRTWLCSILPNLSLCCPGLWGQSVLSRQQSLVTLLTIQPGGPAQPGHVPAALECGCPCPVWKDLL